MELLHDLSNTEDLMRTLLCVWNPRKAVNNFYLLDGDHSELHGLFIPLDRTAPLVRKFRDLISDQKKLLGPVMLSGLRNTLVIQVFME